MSATTHRPPPVQPPHDGGDGATPDGFNPLWLHPLVAAAWLIVMSFVPAWSGLSSWWWAIPGVLLALTSRAVVTQWVSREEHGHQLYGRTRAAAALAVLTAHAWLIYTGQPSTPTGAAYGALVGWTLCAGATYAWLRHACTRAATEIRAETHAAVVEYQHQKLVTELALLWNAWFARVKVAVEVADAVDTPAGYTLHLDVEPDETGAIPRFSDLTGAVSALAPLVSKHYSRLGKDIAVDQLRPEETPQAHRWLMHVDTEQPLRKTLYHPGDRGPASILDPCDLGIYQDGKPLQLLLYGAHSLMVGSTGSGKSVLLNNVIAEMTRRPDVELWIGTTSKLMPVVWPWLLPWLSGRTARPVIERVAGQGLDEVLLMLRDLYEYGMARNERLGPFGAHHRPTPLDPGLFVIIDEATHPAKNKTAKVFTSDGREWTAAALFDACCAMLRSAGGALFFLTQYGLVDALGSEGTNTLRNVTIRIAGRTEKDYDGQATLSGMDKVKTSRLRDNKLLVQPNFETPRVIPAKTYFLEEAAQIDALAVAHTRYRGSGLPGWLADHLGGSYTERWWPDRQPTLVKSCALVGMVYPVLPGGAMADGFATIPNTTRADRAGSTGMAGAVSMDGATDGATPAAPSPAAPTGTPDPAPQPAPAPTPQTPMVHTRDQANPGQPFTPAPAEGTMNPMDPTTTRSSAADGAVVKDARGRFDDASAAHSTAMAEMREYGPFGKANTLVYRAFHYTGAPASATAADLAIASGLVGKDATSAELAAAAARIARNAAALAGVPAQRVPGEDPANPVIHRAQFLAAWDTAKAEYLAEFGGTDTNTSTGSTGGGDGGSVDPAARVLAAIGTRDDTDWVRVSQLGRDAGLIPADGDTAAMREAARTFSLNLRRMFELPPEAFDRQATGTVVRVGAIREAARAHR